MLDRNYRVIDYVRISVTDRCNLRCVYCMPPNGVPHLTHSEVLSYEALLPICRALASIGVKHIRLTGGEPLVRKNLWVLVAGLKALPGIETVTLTTNGILLAEQLDNLVSAGLDGVNVSLDTLDEAQFLQITRREGLSQVLHSLERALAVPGLNVKLNCVPMGENDSQLLPLANLARSRPLAVRFIEMMPIGLGRHFPTRSEAEVRAILAPTLGSLTPTWDTPGWGPCRYFAPPGFVGRIGFISAMSHQFCSDCNRVRLTATGFLKPCLQYDTGASLAGLSGEDALRRTIEAVIAEKPDGHHFATPHAPGDECHSMNEIGG